MGTAARAVMPTRWLSFVAAAPDARSSGLRGGNCSIWEEEYSPPSTSILLLWMDLCGATMFSANDSVLRAGSEVICANDGLLVRGLNGRTKP